MMLGVRHSGVTAAAGVFRDGGLIRCDLGHVAVLDRTGLETACRECHDAARGEFERLLGPAAAGMA